MIINKTSVSFAGRVPSPRYIPVGVVGDNRVECVEFKLPKIADSQTATMLINCKFADAITLEHIENNLYCADITSQIAGESGNIEAYIRINGTDDAVWNSEKIILCVCNVPDISGKVEEQQPTALERTLSAIAAHNADMEQHSDTMEQISKTASESAVAAERYATAAEKSAQAAAKHEAVSYKPQELTESQQAQARQNIAAASKSEVDKLSEEIVNQTREKPLVYIDGVIPTTKDNVLATMTVKSKWLNIFAYIKIKCQGSSSMYYPKKNFTVTLYQDEARTVPLYITIPGWKHPSNKFVLKANYIDHLHARNIVSARLWSEVVASRSDYDTLPEEFRNSPNNGAIDGFPIIVYTNGSYQGLYTWNIGKDAWLWGMDEENPDHVLMCAETNTNRIYAETPCNFRTLWSGVHEDHWSVEVGTNSDAVKNALNALITCVKDTTDEEFKAQISEHLDVQSAIDYAIFSCFDCGIDNLGKNLLAGKFTPKKWILGRYDNDSTYGLYVDGSAFKSATTKYPTDYQESFSLLFERLQTLYTEEMHARALELRGGILSYANVVSRFERFCTEIGAEAYADDLIPYPEIPSAEDNNIWQIRNFVRDRGVYFDDWVERLTGPVWQIMTGYEWKMCTVSGKTLYAPGIKNCRTALANVGYAAFPVGDPDPTGEYTNLYPLAIPDGASMIRVKCPGLAVGLEEYWVTSEGEMRICGNGYYRRISEAADGGVVYTFTDPGAKYFALRIDQVTGAIPDNYDWSKVSIEFA